MTLPFIPSGLVSDSWPEPGGVERKTWMPVPAFAGMTAGMTGGGAS